MYRTQNKSKINNTTTLTFLYGRKQPLTGPPSRILLTLKPQNKKNTTCLEPCTSKLSYLQGKTNVD